MAGTTTSPPTVLSGVPDETLSVERAKALTPAPFAQAVASMSTTEVRSDVQIEPMRAPTRLAPWAHAIGADVRNADGDELATGRLVLLYDPAGAEAWDGEFRLVAFASAEMDPVIGADSLLPQVGWSWLIEALQNRGAEFLAAGGTVTQTTSTRFGDLHGPRTTVTLELRGSWTAKTPDMKPHLLAFVDLLSAAAGIPPEGVSVLSAR